MIALDRIVRPILPAQSDAEQIQLVVEGEAGEISIVMLAEQGLPGAQGPQGVGAEETQFIAGVTLSGHRVVRFNELGRLIYADAGTPEHAVGTVGITTGAALAGALATVKQNGYIDEPTWTWNVGAPIFLGADGVLTQTEPVAPVSKLSLLVGFAALPTRMLVNIQPAIVLAQ